jgi:SAM-dependent methyltransferase
VTKSSEQPIVGLPYTGVENLEIMREAENYNRYLQELIVNHAAGATRVLDFGAGSGTFAVRGAAAGWDVTAVEPDDGLRRMVTAAGVRAVADVADLPDASFDYAYTLNVLEHITADVDALRALRTKLVRKGRLLVYVPAFPILFTSMDAKVRHVRRYKRGTLRTSLVAAGFELEILRYADSLGFAATLLFKALDDGRGDINRSALRLYDRWVFPVSRGLDALTHRWFGKNLLAVAKNPG